MGLTDEPSLWDELCQTDLTSSAARKIIMNIQNATMAKLLQLETQWEVGTARQRQGKAKKGPTAGATMGSLGIRVLRLRKKMKESINSDVEMNNAMAKLLGETGNRAEVQQTLRSSFFGSKK